MTTNDAHVASTGTRKIILGAVTVAAIAGSSSAYALNFDFSFTDTNGGVVTGEIFGLRNNAFSAPTDVVIDGAPFGPAGPFDLFDHGSHWYTSHAGFRVANGQITSGHYTLMRTAYPDATLIFDKTEHKDQYKVSQRSTVGPTGFGGAAFANTTAQSGPGTTSTAPEPASIALLGAGLSGIAGFRRPRASA